MNSKITLEKTFCYVLKSCVGLAVISGVLKVVTLTSGFPVKTQSVTQFLLLNRRNQ